MYYGGVPAREDDGGGSLDWVSYDPPAAGCAFAEETLSPSFSLYGVPAQPIGSPPCAGFGDIAVVPGGDHPLATQYGYGQHLQPRPHQYLTCLKLGKRQYYGGSATLGESAEAAKRMAVPKCQAEGCDKVLVDAKDYHKRHRVCDMHAKAPCVVVLGAEQRFCQQCSRFQPISEFDAAKRSCRRRLAGHNQRRRKTTGNESIMRNTSLESTTMSSKFPYTSSDSSGCAFSLLSSVANPWASLSSPELSTRSSAALRELIAENRATIYGRQLCSDRIWQCPSPIWDPYQQQLPFQVPVDELPNGWNHFQESGNHVTLDLLQMPTSSVEFLPARNKSKDKDECCGIWNP